MVRSGPSYRLAFGSRGAAYWPAPMQATLPGLGWASSLPFFTFTGRLPQKRQPMKTAGCDLGHRALHASSSGMSTSSPNLDATKQRIAAMSGVDHTAPFHVIKPIRTPRLRACVRCREFDTLPLNDRAAGRPLRRECVAVRPVLRDLLFGTGPPVPCPLLLRNAFAFRNHPIKGDASEFSGLDPHNSTSRLPSGETSRSPQLGQASLDRESDSSTHS